MTHSPLVGAIQFDVQKIINLAQLQNEIAAELGIGITGCALTSDGSIDTPISAQNPATLWILPADVDQSAVDAVIASHVAESDWGVAGASTAFNAVWAVLVADPNATLSPDQKDALLIGLAIKVMQSSNS